MHNPSEALFDLTGVRFTKGIDYHFPPGVTLAPDQRLVLVSNGRAFVHRYGDRIDYVGEWEAGDALADGGERIRVKGVGKRTLDEVTYDDAPPWPRRARGGGSTLQLIAPTPSNRSREDVPEASRWRASGRRDGSPGR